jgi:hypothetical protein
MPFSARRYFGEGIAMKKALFLMLLIFALMPAQAQDEAEPLLEMLGHFPQILDDDTLFLAYTDIELSLGAWLEVPEVNSIEGYEALDEEDRFAYLKALPVTLPPSLRDIFEMELLEDTLDDFGLDFYSIEQSLFTDNPPYREGYFAIRGDFDNQAFIDQRLERGYSQANEEWITLCPSARCEGEYAQSPGDTAFERRGAFLLGENLIIQLADPEYLAETQGILRGEARSYLDFADYDAVARLLTNSDSLSQAVFLRPALIAMITDAMGVDEGIDSLPAYRLFTLAEFVSTEDEVTEVNIILSYDNVEDAETAAQNLETNLNNSNVFSPTVMEELEAELDVVQVFADAESGLFLVQAVLRSPFQVVPSERVVNKSSLFNQVYVSTLLGFDAAWLAMED